MTRQTTTDFAPMRPIGTIRPYGRNPRKNDGKPVDAVAESIRQFGFRQPIVVDADGVIIVGHTRYKAALKLGMAEVPVHVAEMTAAQAKAYRIADNKTGEAAEWDDGLLADELRGLDDFDITGLGFDDDELQRLLHPDGIPGLTDPDAIPENVPQVTQSGDLWLLGSHRLLCGDSTKAADVARVMGGVRASCVFTDPPYGIDYSDLQGRFEKIANDAVEPKDLVSSAISLHRVEIVYICCNWKCLNSMIEAMVSIGIDPKAVIVWDKGSRIQNLARYAKRYELIVYSGPYGGQKTIDDDVWEIGRETRGDHPTAKPVALSGRAIEHASAIGDTVYDPFLGSGTTLIAAEQLNRRCFAIEIEPKYVDVAVKRWEQFTGKTAERVPR